MLRTSLQIALMFVAVVKAEIGLQISLPCPRVSVQCRQGTSMRNFQLPASCLPSPCCAVFFSMDFHSLRACECRSAFHPRKVSHRRCCSKYLYTLRSIKTEALTTRYLSILARGRRELCARRRSRADLFPRNILHQNFEQKMRAGVHSLSEQVWTIRLSQQ